MGLYLDAVGEFWREWVINYDFGHQSNLQVRMFLFSRSRMFAWKLALMRRYYKLVSHASTTDVRQIARRSGLVLTALVALFLLAANCRRRVHTRRRSRNRARPEDAPRPAASIWCEGITALLGRTGV